MWFHPDHRVERPPESFIVRVISSLKEHTELTLHSKNVRDVSRDNLCGLIGMAVKAIIKEVADYILHYDSDN